MRCTTKRPLLSYRMRKNSFVLSMLITSGTETVVCFSISVTKNKQKKKEKKRMRQNKIMKTLERTTNSTTPMYHKIVSNIWWCWKPQTMQPATVCQNLMLAQYDHRIHTENHGFDESQNKSSSPEDVLKNKAFSMSYRILCIWLTITKHNAHILSPVFPNNLC